MRLETDSLSGVASSISSLTSFIAVSSHVRLWDGLNDTYQPTASDAKTAQRQELEPKLKLTVQWKDLPAKLRLMCPLFQQFEGYHGPGTKARLALTLLLYTGQRRSDVIRLGRQHIRDGFMHVRQQKTGVELAIPIHATLAAIIAETPADHLTLLTTQTGKPFSAAGFGNWFRDRCNEAGLAHCSAHGLRTAAARRLAEAGCTMHEIAAITGHASLSEVQRYTKAADQKRLALSAMEKAK